jgi:dipeptidyl aminopeptidase/acylaminoacyl peptidase
MFFELGIFHSERRRFGCLLMLATLAAVLSTTAPARAQKLRSPAVASSQVESLPVLPIESLLNLSYFSDLLVPAISPNNDYVAYTVVVPNRASGDATGPTQPRSYVPAHRLEVWIYSTRSSTRHRISPDGISASAPSWSHDGKSVAFYCGEGLEARICVWHPNETAAQVLNVLVANPHRSGLLRWSNDDKAIITLLPHHQQPGLEQGSQPSQEKVQVFQHDSADARHIPGSEDALPRRSQWSLDLGLINAKDGAVQQLLIEGEPIRWFVLSPNTLRVAVCLDQGELSDDGNAHQFEIQVVQLNSGANLIPPQRAVMFYAGSTISWSPDGEYLAWIARGYCWLASILDGRIERMTSQPQFSANFEPPVWDQEDNVLVLAGGVGDDPSFWSSYQTNGVVNYERVWSFSPRTHSSNSFAIKGHSIAKIIANQEASLAWQPENADSIYLLTQDRDSLQEGFVQLNTRTGQPKVLTEAQRRLAMGGMNLNATPTGNHLVFTAEDAAHSADLWMIANLDFTSETRITDLNPGIRRFRHGHARLLHWTNSNGEERRGTLLLPPDSECSHRCPLITWVYGGAAGSQAINQYGLGTGYQSSVYNLQLLASRGFAVFYPDIPLSQGSPMSEIPADVLSGVNELINLGIADGNRLVLWGQSYGGYSVLATLIRTSRFKAAVAAAGSYDLTSLYGILLDDGTAPFVPFTESGQGRIGISPWADKSRYIENSPWFYLDRVHTPLLIECGTRDVPACLQSDQLFVGLRRLGKTVELRKYPGEGHTIRGETNQIDYWRAVLSWFEKCCR